MDSGSSASVVCPYDDLPCDRVIANCGFGACYVKNLDGKLFRLPKIYLKS